MVVEHRGAIVAEYYAAGFGPDSTHLLMSVSKSLCSITVAALIDDGLIDPARTAETYVPELVGSAYGDATVRELLDMTAAADYSEDYTDSSSEVQAQDRAAGWRTPITGDASDTYEFLSRLRRSREHGEKFEYCSATTDALGWIIEAVTGLRYAEVLSDRLWSRLGASADARIAVDRGGCAIANAGISCTARDLARVGRLMLGGGQIDGRRVISERWVAETMAGGDHEKWLGCAKIAVFPGGSYRNQWWSTGNARGNVYAVGIHGQYIWLDPSTDTVITKFSTAPAPTSMDDTRAHAALFEGISRALEGR
nr:MULTISPECIES: serine hydrolase [unclassified Leucobacter]